MLDTLIAFTRRRLGHRLDFAYTVNAAGLFGSCVALVLYVAAELL